MARRFFESRTLLAAQTPDRLTRLLQDLLIYDAHIDISRYFADENYRLRDRHPSYELGIPRMREGKLGTVMFGLLPGGSTSIPLSPPDLNAAPSSPELERSDGVRSSFRDAIGLSG